MSSFSVRIADFFIRDGIFIPFEKSHSKPKIKFDRYPEDNYAILMIDPDAPSRNNPIYADFLHLLIINNKKIIVPYEPPNPPKNSGRHKYVFYLLKQSTFIDEGKLNLSNISNNSNINRKNFILSDFIRKNRLVIVASTYFETENK